MEESSLVPRSPDTSLLLTKRRCPFGESPRDMKIAANSYSMERKHTQRGPLHFTDHDRPDEKQDDTVFQILMQSQQDGLPTPPAADYSSCKNCWICEKTTDIMPCTFCERGVCEMCVRQCEKCFGVFCSCCATVKYDRHEDHALCLACNAEDIKKRRAKATPFAGLWKG